MKLVGSTGMMESRMRAEADAVARAKAEAEAKKRVEPGWNAGVEVTPKHSERLRAPR